MSEKGWTDELRAIGACAGAVEWAEDEPSFAKAWRSCKRGDWMLWYLWRVGVDRKRLVWVACQCARLSLNHVPAGEDRPRLAIETAEAWSRGDGGVTLADVRRAAAYAFAADAADAASSAAYAADAAASAAYAAAYAFAADAADAAFAADAASSAAYADASAAYAADAASYAADAASSAASAASSSRDRVLAECATIVRREYPTIKSVRDDR